MSKTCPFCNATLNDGDTFCTYCGKPYTAPAQPTSNPVTYTNPAQTSAPTQASTSTYQSSPSPAPAAANPAPKAPQNSPWNTPLPEGTTIVTSNQPKEDIGAKVLCLFLQIALCVTPFLPLFRFGIKKKYVGFSSFKVITETAVSYLDYIKHFSSSISGLDIGIVVFIITSAVFLVIAILGAILGLANIGANSKKFWHSMVESSSAILLESLGMFTLVLLINETLNRGTKALTGYGANLYSITIWFYIAFAVELVVYFVARHFVKKYKFVR